MYVIGQKKVTENLKKKCKNLTIGGTSQNLFGCSWKEFESLPNRFWKVQC